MTKEERNIEYQTYLDWLRGKDKTADEEFDLCPKTPLTKRIPCIVDNVFPNSVRINPHADKTDGTSNMKRKDFFIPLDEFRGYIPSEGDLVFCYVDKKYVSKYHLAVETGVFKFYKDTWGISIPKEIRGLYMPHVEESKISVQTLFSMFKFFCTGFATVPSDVADSLCLNDETWSTKLRFFWLFENPKPFWNAATMCMVSPWLIKCGTGGCMYHFDE